MMLRWSSRPWLGSWRLDISTWSQEKTKREMGKRERLKDLGNVLREVASLFLNPMTDK
jgi:hypothetical protein